MPEWLAKVMGVELPPIPENGTRHLEWAGIPTGENLLFLLLFIAALVGLTAWFYRREGAAPTWQKIALGGLRITVIVLAMLVYFDLRLAVEIEKTLDSVTLVLVDNSLSMSIKDRISRPTLKTRVAEAAGIKDYDLEQTPRLAVVEKILSNPQLDLIKKLGERNDVRIFTFGQKLEEAKLDKDGKLALEARGQLTDLTGGIRAALESVPGKTVAGVIVFSDGQINSGEHPSAISSLLRERNAPLFTVGVGNPDPPKNFEVVELSASPRVYKNDPVLFEGRIKASGFEGETARVTLDRLSRDTGETTTVAKRDVEIKSVAFETKLRFTITPKVAGEFLYSLRIEPREEELIADDNAVSRVLHVIEDDTRVLVLSGSPSREFRFLRNLLMRERTIQVSTWLQTADPSFPQDGNVRIYEMPRTEKELFKYDVVVLLDPVEEQLDRKWVELLRAFVDRHGGGLCYVAGDKHTGRMFRNENLRPLHDLLPVEPDLAGAERMSLPGTRHTERWPMKLTPEGEDHTVTRLTGNTEVLKQVWSKLPGVYWVFPVKKEKPGASVLLRSSDPSRVTSQGAGILLAAHFFGPGRTVFVASDETYAWRGVSRVAYQRFWIQLMRYLVEGRLLGGQRRLTLQTDKDGYDLGDLVTVRVKLLDKSFKPLDGARLTGVVKARGGGESELRLEPQKGRPGSYIGSVVPARPDLYEISVAAPDLGLVDNKAVKGSKTVRVRLPNLEFTDTRLDAALLGDVAEAAGGRLVPINELDTLPKAIPARRQTLKISGNPVTLWDTRLTLVVLIALLGAEWFFRKRCRMV